MPLLSTLHNALSYLSRVCGFETVDSFPAGHPYARTRWNPAYFDIASDLKAEQIERSLCESIANTPLIFAHIVNPTPRMQRALLSVIETRMRRSCGDPLDLVALLVEGKSWRSVLLTRLAHHSTSSSDPITGWASMSRCSKPTSQGIQPRRSGHASCTTRNGTAP